VLLGETRGWLGQSLYLRDLCGREAGAPPPVDLPAERCCGDLVHVLIAAGMASAVHDVSDGGTLVAIAEMAIASGIGARLERGPNAIAPHAFWFGEDQGRYVITVRERDLAGLEARAKSAGVPVHRLGTTGGDALTLPDERPILVTNLSQRFEAWLPDYMAGGRA
jgi:phosphoribosylformylglycinamidine synthase